MNKNLLILLFWVVLAGCTMAPKYQRPEAPVSPGWPSGPAYDGIDASKTNVTNAWNIGWREFFNDPRLQKLIELALTNNRDMRITVLNVDQARAQYRIARAPLFPKINASGTGARQRIPADLSGIGTPMTVSQFSVGLGGTAYELDIFGRVRSLKAQALERYFATEQARRGVHISLVAEVAMQYLSERTLADQLEVAQKTLKSVQANLDLIQKSFDIGNNSELDVQSAEAQVQTARANEASIQRQHAQAENALALLIGQPIPDSLPRSNPLDSRTFLADLPPGLPSELLRRRPDVLEAEHLLKAANANIGAARAAFFPTITLTGSVGSASSQLANLFSGGSAAWSFAPQITMPIFDAGKNAANLDVAKLSKLIEVAQYEKTIQSAFREVADALAARATLENQIDALESLVKAQQQRFQLADIRYRNGIESYLTVLTAQQDLYNAQQSLLQSLLFRYTNRVMLYKALGGGWLDHTVTDPQSSLRAAE